MIGCRQPAGHPLHPAIAHFPVAFWIVAPAADVTAAGLGEPFAARLAGWALAAGTGTGVIAMLAGAADYARIPRGHAGSDTAAAHMLAMGSAWVLFATALALRGAPARADVPLSVVAIELVGAAVLLVGAGLGGSLVYRRGIGTRPPQAPAQPGASRSR